MDMDNVVIKINRYKNPDGSKNFPAKTCKDLKHLHPRLNTGKCFQKEPISFLIHSIWSYFKVFQIVAEID